MPRPIQIGHGFVTELYDQEIMLSANTVPSPEPILSPLEELRKQINETMGIPAALLLSRDESAHPTARRISQREMYLDLTCGGICQPHRGRKHVDCKVIAPKQLSE